MSCPHGNPIGGCDTCDEVDAAFEAGKRSALAEQPAQQEPVQNNPLDCNVYLGSGKDHAIKHYVSYGPAQRTWVNATTWRGLTEQEALDCFSPNPVTHSKNVEAKLRSNT